MDDIDLANQHIEQEMALRMKAMQTPIERAFPPKGECYNCGAVVAAEKVYCDKECAADHAWALRRGAQN